MRETWVLSLGQEDPLEKEMATHSSIACLENPMDRGAWGAKVHGVADRHSSATNTFYFLEGTMQEFSAPNFLIM